MNSNEDLTWQGIELVSLVLGFIGAVLGIAYMPKMGKAQLFSALVAGIMVAGLGTPGVEYAFVHWLPDWVNPTHTIMPKVLSNIVAFLLGIGGMFIIPGVIVFWRNPVGFIGWIRGRGPMPNDPHIDADGEIKP